MGEEANTGSRVGSGRASHGERGIRAELDRDPGPYLRGRNIISSYDTGKRKKGVRKSKLKIAAGKSSVGFQKLQFIPSKNWTY